MVYSSSPSSSVPPRAAALRLRDEQQIGQAQDRIANFRDHKAAGFEPVALDERQHLSRPPAEIRARTLAPTDREHAGRCHRFGREINAMRRIDQLSLAKL